MGVVWAIAKATYRESIRQRVLFVVFILGLMLIAVSVAFSYLSTGEEFRFVVDFGLVGITMVGLGLAVILGGFMIPTEIERRVVFTILSKPVSRMQYLVGKFLGAASVIFVLDVLMGVAFCLAYVNKHPQGIHGFTYMLPMALLAVYFQTIILLATALMLSTIASPVFTMIATGFVYIMGAVNSSVTYLSNRADSIFTRPIRHFLRGWSRGVRSARGWTRRGTSPNRGVCARGPCVRRRTSGAPWRCASGADTRRAPGAP